MAPTIVSQCHLRDRGGALCGKVHSKLLQRLSPFDTHACRNAHMLLHGQVATRAHKYTRSNIQTATIPNCPQNSVTQSLTHAATHGYTQLHTKMYTHSQAHCLTHTAVFTHMQLCTKRVVTPPRCDCQAGWGICAHLPAEGCRRTAPGGALGPSAPWRPSHLRELPRCWPPPAAAAPGVPTNTVAAWPKTLARSDVGSVLTACADLLCPFLSLAALIIELPWPHGAQKACTPCLHLLSVCTCCLCLHTHTQPHIAMHTHTQPHTAMHTHSYAQTSRKCHTESDT